MDLHEKVAWVVGASSGIGAAVARELQARGAVVAVSARRQPELEEVAGGRMLVAPADITDAAGLAAAAQHVTAELGAIDLVVVTAGTWQQLSVDDWDTEAFRRQVEVNLIGLSNTAAAVLPAMLDRGSGTLAGVASLAGYRGLAGAEAYSAAKAGQIALLEALRVQVAERGVRVTTINPGFVRTPKAASGGFPMPFVIDPDAAGRAICDGLERDRVEIAFPLRLAIPMKLARLLPARLWPRLFGRPATPPAAPRPRG
jgi:NAD(P)-dependent dehydrogenase (short-subunit alcohol dehydrogenase family)